MFMTTNTPCDDAHVLAFAARNRNTSAGVAANKIALARGNIPSQAAYTLYCRR